MTVADSLDRALSSEPDFGDSALITARVVERYRFAIDILSDRFPVLADANCAARLASFPDASQRLVLRDPVVQWSLEDALTALEADALVSPHPIETVLPLALHAAPGSLSPTATQFASVPRVGVDRRLWLWPVPVDSLVGVAGLPALPTFLYANFCQQYTRGGRGNAEIYRDTLVNARIHQPTQSQVAVIDQALSIITSLLPTTGRGVLQHVSSIGVMEAESDEGRILSAAGGDLLPSTFFIAPTALGDPWDVAGRIFHEALHLKIFDVLRQRTLIRDPQADLEIPWRNVHWSLPRALFAFHVYGHLLAYQAAVRDAPAHLRTEYGEPSGTGVSRAALTPNGQYVTAADRFEYLSGRLTGAWAPFLTRDGARFVEWMSTVVGASTEGRSAAVRPSGSHAAQRGRFAEQTTGSSAFGENRERIVPVHGVQTRTYRELGSAIMFVPTSGTLHWVNLKALLLFQLCEEMPTRSQLAESYGSLLSTDASAVASEVASGVEALATVGAVRT